MPKKFLLRICPVVILLSAPSALAFDCSNLVPYSLAGVVDLAQGKLVQNHNYAYECVGGRYCRAGAWGFEPGAGQYWSSAWRSLGECSVEEPEEPITGTPILNLLAPEAALAGTPNVVYLNAWSVDSALSLTPLVSPNNYSLVLASQNSQQNQGGFLHTLTYQFTAFETGLFTVEFNSPSSNLSESEVIEILPADGTPVLSMDLPVSVRQDEILSVEVLVKDLGGIDHMLFSVDGVTSTPISSVPIGESPVYGRRYSYQFVAEKGAHQISVSATDADGNVVRINKDLLVEGSDDVESGGCATLGVNPEQVNDYPNWTRVDWKGDPNHANTGDLMEYQSSVFRANWWTQSVPGSDHSWTLYCDN